MECLLVWLNGLGAITVQQARSHEEHSGAVPPNGFSIAPNFVLIRYNKNKNLDRLKMYFAIHPKP